MYYFNFRATAVIFIVFAISYLTSAFGFTLNRESGELKGWVNGKVIFHLQSQQCPPSLLKDQLIEIIQNAIAPWTQIATSNLKIELGSDSEQSLAQVIKDFAPGEPIIFCDPDLSSHIGGESNKIPAVTLGPLIESVQKQILFSAILMNVESNKSSNIINLSSASLEVILAHEIGHVLGLGHSQDPKALMYFNLSGKKSTALSQDDMNGASYLYPAQEPFLTSPLGCSNIRSMHSEKNSHRQILHDSHTSQFAAFFGSLMGSTMIILIVVFLMTFKRNQ